MSNPLPCPFCGDEMKSLYLEHPEVYRHSDHETCFARRAIIHPQSLVAWNTRAALNGERHE